MSKHTAGPWVISDVTDMVQEKHEKPLGPIFWIGPDEFTSIAEVRAGSTDDGLPKQVTANAHLIASAPELFEALKMCKDRITRLEGSWANAGLLSDIVDNAISKAEGK